jgi:hypothetical protein
MEKVPEGTKSGERCELALAAVLACVIIKDAN